MGSLGWFASGPAVSQGRSAGYKRHGMKSVNVNRPGVLGLDFFYGQRLGAFGGGLDWLVGLSGCPGREGPGREVRDSIVPPSPRT